MKKLISLFSLSLCCFAASAQPTSIGGITPGKTTLGELKGLTNMWDGVTGDMRYVGVSLKQLEGKPTTVHLQNGVVYQVNIDISFSPVLNEALIAKYGQPNTKDGKIRTVNCQNQFGAISKRYEGEESQLWPVKDGVQGGIESFARRCEEYISVRYVLRHVATVEAMKQKEEEEARSKAEKQRSKIDGAL